MVAGPPEQLERYPDAGEKPLMRPWNGVKKASTSNLSAQSRARRLSGRAESGAMNGTWPFETRRISGLSVVRFEDSQRPLRLVDAKRLKSVDLVPIICKTKFRRPGGEGDQGKTPDLRHHEFRKAVVTDRMAATRPAGVAKHAALAMASNRRLFFASRGIPSMHCSGTPEPALKRPSLVLWKTWDGMGRN